MTAEEREDATDECGCFPPYNECPHPPSGWFRVCGKPTHQWGVRGTCGGRPGHEGPHE